MIYSRYIYQGKVRYGIVKQAWIEEISPDYFSHYKFTGERVELSKVKLLAPCQPSKIVAAGLNYRDHARELQMALPKVPVIFLKPPSAIIGPEDKIIRPAISQRVDYEAELAVVIKKETRNISPDEAVQHILGFTCFNDITARDLQDLDGQWTRSKSFDTFAPFGPWIVDGIDPNNLKIKLFVDGQEKQSSTTANFIFSLEEIVSFVSQVMTLYPGDLIATGTPAGIGPLVPGNEVVVEIEDIGRLRNFVA
ncbi:MAG: fumarylacetoacetate hydrolase family protein [Elusimicrobiota bacterium]